MNKSTTDLSCIPFANYLFFLNFFLLIILGVGACNNIKPPPGDIDHETVDIMPNINGQIDSSDGKLHLQGSWYWYKNIGSNIKEIVAVKKNSDSTVADTNDKYSWYNPDNGVDTSSDDDETRRTSGAVDKICVSGSLLSGGDPSEERYIGIGFSLCTAGEDSEDLKQFPYTVGTCPLGGAETLLRKFLGVSFKVTPYEGKGYFPDSSKFIVQFKERGKDIDDKQPYCVVLDKLTSDTELEQQGCEGEKFSDEYQVKAWHGEAMNHNRALDTDADLGERNLWALQGIHFQVISDVDLDFSFCLSDISALAAEHERSEESNLGKEVLIDTGSVPHLGNDVPRKKLEEMNAELNDDTDPWVKARDESDGGDFCIMKEEVSVEQFYKCIEARICSIKDSTSDVDIRRWESCTPYRYKLADDVNDTLEKSKWAKISANCVTWQDASRFCQWIGGDLPTKEQWEYAARSGATDIKYPYPWGTTEPDCQYALFYDSHGSGCGNNGVPEPGCEKAPYGNTETGACDMIGNLWEWVNDSYAGGTPDQHWLEGYRVIKGGAFDTINQNNSIGQNSFTISQITSAEHPMEPHNPNHLGFRCIKPLGIGGSCNVQSVK